MHSNRDNHESVSNVMEPREAHPEDREIQMNQEAEAVSAIPAKWLRFQTRQLWAGSIVIGASDLH
jgi:hypothetical protein